MGDARVKSRSKGADVVRPCSFKFAQIRGYCCQDCCQFKRVDNYFDALYKWMYDVRTCRHKCNTGIKWQGIFTFSSQRGSRFSRIQHVFCEFCNIEFARVSPSSESSKHKLLILVQQKLCPQRLSDSASAWRQTIVCYADALQA